MRAGEPFVRRRVVRDPRVRLVCIPHAGAGASEYYGWEDAVEPDCEVVAVQLPGRQNRFTEPPHRSVPDAVRVLGDALAPLTEVPVVVFGHSMGALLAFELARLLRREWGIVPAHLFLSARAHGAAGRAMGLSSLSDEELREVVVALDGPDSAMAASPELFDLLSPTLRADFEMCESYVPRPEPPLSCPITAVAGRNDPAVPAGGLCGWATQTTTSFRSLRPAGGHHYLRHDPSAVLELVTTTVAAVGT